MISGMETALSEITLILFPTLAPSAAMAFSIMGLPIMLGRVSDQERKRLHACLCIPLTTALIGLVASATHLGNPSNALFVFLGVGSSPLSNEVFCAVVFLMLAGVYWLYSFAERPRERLQRAWMGLIIASSIAFIASIGFAYSASTIITWNMTFLPAVIWLNALLGGPVFALLGFRVAGYRVGSKKLSFSLCLVSMVAWLPCVLLYAVQGAELEVVRNSFAYASELVPQFDLMLIVFAALSILGIALGALGHPALLEGVFEHHLSSLKRICNSDRGASVCITLLGVLLVFAGIFVMRFAFYLSHMTIGLGM